MTRLAPHILPVLPHLDGPSQRDPADANAKLRISQDTRWLGHTHQVDEAAIQRRVDGPRLRLGNRSLALFEDHRLAGSPAIVPNQKSGRRENEECPKPGVPPTAL